MIAKTPTGSTYDYGFCGCDHCHHEIGIGFCLLTARGRPDSFRGRCVNNRSDIRGGDRWRRSASIEFDTAIFRTCCTIRTATPSHDCGTLKVWWRALGWPWFRSRWIAAKGTWVCVWRRIARHSHGTANILAMKYQLHCILGSYSDQTYRPIVCFTAILLISTRLEGGYQRWPFGSRIIKSIYPVGCSSHGSNR